MRAACLKDIFISGNLLSHKDLDFGYDLGLSEKSKKILICKKNLISKGRKEMDKYFECVGHFKEPAFQ